MTYKERRQTVLDAMQDQSMLVLYSGAGVHISADDYHPFEANRNFFYLTGLRRENMILVMLKQGESEKTMLFIEKADPNLVRWTGKRVSVEEAKERTEIDEIYFIDSFQSRINRTLVSGELDNLYFDCNRYQWDDMPDYNAAKAKEFAEKYPALRIRDLFPIVAKLRVQKGEEELQLMRKAISITDTALQNVMTHLAPGRKEYQVQADFEYTIHFEGADGVAFQTIAGSGANGTMLHYGTNRDTCEDGTLVLLDLGAKYEGYCADITRTYPVNGKYSDRQRKVYDIVLKANREVVKAAKAGVRLSELQKLCSDILAEGCIELGLIEDKSEVRRYYMHGVSHHLGIDVHDVTSGQDAPLPVGAVITDEPGLYIDEWGIGIRIEDDLLIQEDGCEVLSADIIRDPDEIEAFMASHKA